MTSALDAIMAGFRGTMPAVKVPAPTGVVNPPEAARVVAETTTAEVAGEAPPEVDPVGAAPAPTAKPAAIIAAEQAPKQRRTAAVVQAELDAMTAERDALRTTVEALQARVQELAEKTQTGAVDALAAEGQLIEENGVLRARIAELEANANLDSVKLGELEDKLERAQSASYDCVPRDQCTPTEDLTADQLCGLLADRGFGVQLTYGGAR